MKYKEFNRLKGSMLMQNVLAIDVAKGKSMVTLISSCGEVLIEPYEINHSIIDFTNLLNRIKAQKLVSDRATVLVPVMLACPFFPDDAICMVSGMTKMKFGYFSIMALLTRSIGIALTALLGNDVVVSYILNTLGNNLIPVAFSALALATKGTMSKIGAWGVAGYGVFTVLKEGFGLGKNTPVD